MKKFLLLIGAALLLSFSPALWADGNDPQVVTGDENYGADGTPNTYGVWFDGAGDHLLSISSAGGAVYVGSSGGISFDPNGQNGTGGVQFSGANTVTISGTTGVSTANDLSSLDFDGSGNTIFQGNVYAELINFSAEATMTLNDGVNVNGAITNANGDEGTLVLKGNHTLTGNVGSTGAGLHLITVGDGSTDGKTVTIDGDVKASTINFANDNTLNIAAGHNVQAAIEASTSGEGTLVSQGTNAFTGAIGATNPLAEVRGGADGAITTFNNNVSATNATVTGTGTVAFNGDFSGTALNFDSTGTAKVANTKNINADVTTDTGGNGTLQFLGNSTVNGDVGTSGASLGAVRLGNNDASGDGDTVAFTGDVYTDTFNFNDDGIATIASGKNLFASTISVTGNGEGTLTYLGNVASQAAFGAAGNALKALNVSGGTLTLNHDVFATTLTVDAANTGGTLTPGAGRTITGNLTLANSGILNLGTNTLTLDGTGIYTQSAGTTLNLNIINTTTFGNIAVAGTATNGNASVATGSTINVTVADNYLLSGTAFRIIDGTGGAGVLVPTTITDDSYVIDFIGSSSNGDLVLTVSRTNSYDNAAGSGNSGAVGAALEAGGTGAVGDFLYILSILDSMVSGTEIDDALQQMDPDNSGGSLAGTYALLNQLLNAIGNRLGFARNGFVGGGNGFSSGDMFQGTGFWMQGMGNHAKQDTRKGVPGYQANTFGTAAGIDKQLSDHFRGGAAFGYSYANVNSKDTGRPRTGINSFQGTLYGSYDPREQKAPEEGTQATAKETDRNYYYVDGILAFAHNEYESVRDIDFSNVLRHAYADYSGQQYAGKLESGYTFIFERTQALEVTPIASLEYSYLYTHGYTETGADSLNLKVEGEGYHALEQGLGMKFAYPFRSKKIGTLIPAVKGMWLYDYIGEKPESTSSFAGGGPSFKTSGAEPAQSAMVWGAEVAWLNKGNMTLTANYDWETKDEFSGHTYYLTARLDF
ncbi:MAG: autotransporter outer membrane beta-barrel domain-containing protein [Candidatus Omnitrophota bacterium]